MRRRLSVVLALAATLAVVASGGIAHADGAAPAGATVTIAPSDGGAPRPLTLAALAGSFDVHDATYTLRAADGTTSTVTVADGISLGALIAAAGLDGDPFAYVEIPRSDGTSAYVLGDHVGDAVVWTDAQGVHFLRLSSGDGDANADDDLTFPDGRLAVDLHTGSPLQPRIRVSTLRARLHERVDFGASLAAGTLAPGMAFSWYFDGDGSAIGAHVAHRFSRGGTYTVVLNVVRGAQELTVLPAVVHVRVSSAPPHGATGAPGTGARGAVTGSGSRGSGTAGGSGAGAGSGAASGGAVDPRATPTAAASRPRATAAAPRRVLPTPPAPTPPGQLVSGTLVASASAALPLASGGGRPASAAPAGAAAGRGPLHVPVGAWVAIGLAVLLGLGWALESRHTLPFWQP